MKRIFFAFLLLSLVGSLNAQNQRKDQNYRKDHDRRKDQVRQEVRARHQSHRNLNLTSEQGSKIKAINQNFRDEIKELRNQELTAQARNEKKHQLQKQHVEQIQAVLTAEQKEQLAKNKKEQKEKIASERKEKAEKISTKLNLSEQQRQSVIHLRETYKTKAESIRNDNALTKEQKSERLQELTRQQREDMKAILTEEQIKQLQERRNSDKKRK